MVLRRILPSLRRQICGRRIVFSNGGRGPASASKPEIDHNAKTPTTTPRELCEIKRALRLFYPNTRSQRVVGSAACEDRRVLRSSSRPELVGGYRRRGII